MISITLWNSWTEQRIEFKKQILSNKHRCCAYAPHNVCGWILVKANVLRHSSLFEIHTVNKSLTASSKKGKKRRELKEPAQGKTNKKNWGKYIPTCWWAWTKTNQYYELWNALCSNDHWQPRGSDHESLKTWTVSSVGSIARQHVQA